MKQICILFLGILLFSCAKAPEEYIPFIEGYWEISEVRKDGDLVKSYTINMTIDYFKVNDDRTGFRKKVSPSLDGRFATTEDAIPFELISQNDTLYIVYTKNGTTYREQLEKATFETMVISNTKGFTYIYKPYEKIELD